jgi:hypothetical protein
VIERIVARLGRPGTQRARFPGGDRALATTSGRHHGQAIRIDSFEVDDCLILERPPGSVKARRRILPTPGRCTNKERCPRIERVADRLFEVGDDSSPKPPSSHGADAASSSTSSPCCSTTFSSGRGIAAHHAGVSAQRAGRRNHQAAGCTARARVSRFPSGGVHPTGALYLMAAHLPSARGAAPFRSECSGDVHAWV